MVLSASVVLHLCVKRHASKADRADWTVVNAFIIMPTEHHLSSFNDGLAFFVLLGWLLSPNLRRTNLPVVQLDRMNTHSGVSLAETADSEVQVTHSTVPGHSSHAARVRACNQEWGRATNTQDTTALA